VVPAAIRSKPSAPSGQESGDTHHHLGARRTICREMAMRNRALHPTPAAVIVDRIHRPPRQVRLVVMSFAALAFGVE
jgi:hypothetical protein